MIMRATVKKTRHGRPCYYFCAPCMSHNDAVLEVAGYELKVRVAILMHLNQMEVCKI